MKNKRQIIKNYGMERGLFQRRLVIIATLVTGLIVLLFIRLCYLQIFEHGHYDTLSSNNHIEMLPIEPNRGLIYDRNGVLLADNIPVYSLEVTPDNVPDMDAMIAQLRKIIHLDQDDIDDFYRALQQRHGFEPTSLKIKLSEREVAAFYVNQYRFPGVNIEAKLIRTYPLGSAMVSVLGYVGRINPEELTKLDKENYAASNFIGKSGIEKYYEEKLHGEVGYQKIEVDAGGRVIKILGNVAPTSGDDIYLTIDSKLQSFAAKALGTEHGAIVAIKPNTGEVLALVSNPSFNPNLFVNGISTADFTKLQNSPGKPLYNRAIRGQFPMASTIKPFMAIEGLDSKVITKDYTIYDPGWFKLPNVEHVYRDWTWWLDKGGHGNVNVTKAIIVSSDTFFYNLAVKLGIDRIDYGLTRFGFGSKLNIDMDEELGGLVPSPKWKWEAKKTHWYTGDTVISGIGQGFMLTTPLQLANAVAIIANRGLRYQPHLLMQSKLPDGTMVIQQPIAEKSIALSNNAIWDIVIHAMQGVISSYNPPGTARLTFGSDTSYSVAGKTGTGQVYSHRAGEDNEQQDYLPKRLRNHSYFIAFAPVNQPKIAIAVVAENSMIAAKVARRVLDYYLLEEPNEKTSSNTTIESDPAVRNK
jgi:penicillin-binding protein 2